MTRLKMDVGFNYDFLWILYFIGTGLATYYIFNANILYIVLGIIGLEVLFYIVYRKNWYFFKRYVFNLFYLLGIAIPFIAK